MPANQLPVPTPDKSNVRGRAERGSAPIAAARPEFFDADREGNLWIAFSSRVLLNAAAGEVFELVGNFLTEPGLVVQVCGIETDADRQHRKEVLRKFKYKL